MTDTAKGAVWSVLEGDAVDRLRALPDASVQCCVTSPPYYGLRDYGVPARIWGGEHDCDHEFGEGLVSRAAGYDGKTRWQHSVNGRGEVAAERRDIDGWERVDVAHGAYCARCGAWYGALGLEPHPDQYVANIVEVFREVRRVLADDGTLWLNLGDSYNNRAVHRPSSHQAGLGFTSDHIATPWREHAANGRARASINDGHLKEKDLVGTPWMVAFALRADGWYLRSEIIWAKPSPMPESVGDRPTRSHEHVFLLAKRRHYFYDADAIREPDKGSDHPRQVLDGQPSLEPSGGIRSPHRGLRTSEGRDGRGRNRRTVWTVTTQPFPDAHFATFPPALVEPCVLAGSRPGDVVLDPFAGAGTTLMVAQRLGRSSIGIELSPEYVELARRRIVDDAPLLNSYAETPLLSAEEVA